MPFGDQLLIHLRAKAVNQHDTHAHALNQRQILRQRVQAALGYRLARHADHKGLVAELVDVRRNRAKPRHKTRINQRCAVVEGMRAGGHDDSVKNE